MNKKYTIISRDEFVKLYKFGKLSLIYSQIIDENKEKIKILEKLLNELPFDDEFGFLIIKFSFLQKDFKSLYSLDIKNLETIYCLSKSAQEWYSIKFNSKIKFQTMDNLDMEKIKELKELEDIKKGSEVIFKMFENSLEKREVVKDKLTEISLKEHLLNFHKEEDYFKLKHKDFYLDLISYQRENKFKKEDVSFFYDLMIITLLKDRKDEYFKLYKSGNFPLVSSKSYQLLEQNKQKNLYQYIKFIKNSQNEKIQKFKSKFKNFESLVIGAIFLKMRELLDEDEGRKSGYQDEIKKLVNEFKDNYKQELSVAFYLIGSLFGYSKLYDDFYDVENLNIFQEEVLDKETSEVENFGRRIEILQKDNDSKSQELEELQKEKDSKIEELEKAKAILEREKEAEIKKLEAERRAKEKLEELQQEKDSKIEELEKANRTFKNKKEAKIILEKKKIERECNSSHIEDSTIEKVEKILKDINDVNILKNIVKKLALTTKAKTDSGLKKAIRKQCTRYEEVEQLKKIISGEKKDENLFEPTFITPKTLN
jgi:hypothetical protein